MRNVVLGVAVCTIRAAFLTHPSWPHIQIARKKLITMGIHIDGLSDDQVVYATDYSAGT
ncbi:MAG: hypothetical protein AAF089_05495 [Bacteroidota bacterium]